MKKVKGFTLIELVIVVSIISVLATIVTPKVRMSLIKAKDVKAEATLETLKTASNLYFSEKNRMLGSENSVTGSGVSEGEETIYIPYEGKEKLKTVTVAHIKELIKKKYLEKSAIKLFINDGEVDTNPIKILPGVNMERNGNCDEQGEITDNAVLESQQLYFVFDSDKVGISIWDGKTGVTTSIKDGLVDNSCQVWNLK